LKVFRFGSDGFLVSGHWQHGQLGPGMGKERPHDLIAGVLALG
jgi:hypothetical protein